MKFRSFKVVILAVLFLFLLSNVSFGASSFLNIKIDGEKIQVREVPILMDGKVLKSDSPSFLYVDRTLVSARLIAENYGAKVTWDSSTRTAIINHSGNKIELTINSDLAKINGRPIKLDKYSIPKIVDFGNGDGKTMVPLTFLAEVLGYETDWDEVEKAAYLKKKETTSPSGGEEPAEDGQDKDKEDLVKPSHTGNYIRDIKLGERANKDVIIISGDKLVKRNILKLESPKRLVIDLLDSNLYGTDYLEKKYDVGNIKKIRVSQFSPDKNYKEDDRIVRVVIDMEEYSNWDDIQIAEEAGDLVLTPKKDVRNNLSYNKENNTISIKANDLTDFNIHYDRENFKLTISGPSENLDLPMGKMDVLSPLLIDYEVRDLGRETEVVCHFRRDINYQVTSGYTTKNLLVNISKNGVIEKKDRLIVVDPGHGGNDPGTSSKSGIKEKDIALKISLKLRDKLERAGYGKVLMTRDTDKTLVLKDRPKFANDNYADLFVSIHGNSVSGNSSVKGIEVLYTPKADNYMKGDQQTHLARLVQDELIKATGTSNRGIKKRPNLVVIRDTKMPSILVETGFLSNPTEASKLNSDSYQDLVAEAIFKGIEKYFNIYN